MSLEAIAALASGSTGLLLATTRLRHEPQSLQQVACVHVCRGATCRDAKESSGFVDVQACPQLSYALCLCAIFTFCALIFCHTKKKHSVIMSQSSELL